MNIRVNHQYPRMKSDQKTYIVKSKEIDKKNCYFLNFGLFGVKL